MFLPAQMSDTQETVLTSVKKALQVTATRRPKHVSCMILVLSILAPWIQQLLWACVVPWRKVLKTEHCCEYIDFCLLLPNFMHPP